MDIDFVSSSLYARFQVVNRSGMQPDLPETIGTVSTVGLRTGLNGKTWHEFWKRILALNIIEYDRGEPCSLGLLFMWYPISTVIGMSLALPWIWLHSYNIFKIRKMCQEYSGIFETAGFRIDCQRTTPDCDKLLSKYYIYVYPMSMEYVRFEVADDYVFRCRSSTNVPLIPLRDDIPKALQSLKPGVWNEFSARINNYATAYIKAYRRSNVVAFTSFMLSVVWSIVRDCGTIAMIIWYTHAGLNLLQLYYCFKMSDKSISCLELPRLLPLHFKEQGIEVEFRCECEPSVKRMFNSVTGQWRWCLYVFPFSAKTD